MPKKRSHGDGALYYIKSRQLWRGVIDLEPDPNSGKRRQKYVHAVSQAACRKKLLTLQKEIDEHGVPLDRNTTVATWTQAWLHDHKKPYVDPQTYSVYASAVKKWINPTIGHKKVAVIRPADIRRVHVTMREAGRATGTIHVIHNVMKMLFEQGRIEGLCAKNVVLDVQAPPNSQENRDAIPLPDAARILEVAAEQDLGSFWWFKLLGGQRQSELLGATLDSLDLNAGIYEVNWSLESVPREHGCGDPIGDEWPCGKFRGFACPDARRRIPHGFVFREIDDRWCLTRPKSATGRTVPLIPQLRAMTGEYLARHAAEPNPHGLIWRKPDGAPIYPKEDAQEWRNLLHQAGLITKDQLGPSQSPITGHWARHTTVTLLASLGVDFQIIGEIVGHSSAEVTRIYRHASTKEKATAMERLGTLMLTSSA